MPSQQVTVYRLGDLFEVRDLNNNLVTNRDILDQIAFDQMPGFRASYSVVVDLPDTTMPPTPQRVNINIRT